MLITITSKLENDVQLWTFNIRESDLIELMQKYEGRGESVLIDAAELPEDIKHYYE